MSSSDTQKAAAPTMTIPNFVIIGAAKSGTTALYWYLAEHPEVFMSPLKETNFFAYGLDDEGRLLYGDPELHKFPIKTEDAYLALFEDAGSAKAVGEASPIYLECPQTAGRIRDRLPDARIICGLRHPVDRAYSDYLMYLRNRGRRFDIEAEFRADAPWANPDSHWMQLGFYHDQLVRYYSAFDPAHIHTFLFDDLRVSERAVVQGIYRFLEVDDGFLPDFETPHNVGGLPGRLWLEQLLTNKAIRRLGEPLLSKRATSWVRSFRMRNMGASPPLPASMRAELTMNFHRDLAETGNLIGRDLSRWF